MFSRKKKFLANTIAGVLKQIITVLCGFILPRYMLVYYGSEVNGLISSITHFLCLISFLDMNHQICGYKKITSYENLIEQKPALNLITN